MMRLRSSRSSISCTCARALRSITSMARAATSARFGSPPLQQHLRPAQDGAQRRAQLVRQRRQELVLDPRGALRGHARAALGLQHLLALLTGELDAPRPACVSVRSRVSLAKPTSWPASSRSAVMVTFAQNVVPSLRTRQPLSTKLPFSAATCSSCSGQPLSLASGGIEDREVLADDLVGRVALDPLRADVPGGDPCR